MKLTALTFFLLLIAVFVGTLSFIFYGFSPVSKAEVKSSSFIVKQGESVKTIADKLEATNLIHSSFILRLYYRLVADSHPVQSGTYDLSPSFSMPQVVRILTQGSKDNWVTLVEGWRSEEMADELALKLSAKTFDKTEFIARAKPLEGRLFPDTYLIPKEATAGYVINLLSSTFDKKVKPLYSSAAFPNSTLILASLIEREARDPDAMKIVAGILTNRLKLGMPLQVDATLQYAVGYDKVNQTYWPVPKSTDKSIDSPFNTYANKGLPPSPICNPGINAIQAALRPTPTDYLFYISDLKGNMHYAATLADHNENINRYLR